MAFQAHKINDLKAAATTHPTESAMLNDAITELAMLRNVDDIRFPDITISDGRVATNFGISGFDQDFVVQAEIVGEMVRWHKRLGKFTSVSAFDRSEEDSQANLFTYEDAIIEVQRAKAWLEAR